MTEIADLLDQVMDYDAGQSWPSDRPHDASVVRGCDGCGEDRPDVDLWATNDGTGEELWLCLSCGL